jgi:GMP synthase (glutamine-hydrolysing)
MTADSGTAGQPPLLAILEHAEDEGPGLIARLAAAAGMAVLRVGAADPLPGLDGVTALAVMGGPQAVYQRDPRLVEEIALIHRAMTGALPVLGVCLGAQLVATACGAAVRPGPAGPELGLGSATLTPAGRDDPLFSGCGESVPVLHWHRDTFALPAGSCHLARSAVYPIQAFRLGRAYGIQFHLEVDAELLSAWAPALNLAAGAEEWLIQTEPVRARILATWIRRAIDTVR